MLWNSPRNMKQEMWLLTLAFLTMRLFYHLFLKNIIFMFLSNRSRFINLRKRHHMMTLAKQSKRQSASTVNEMRLFHGTSPDVVDAICKHNFDWRVCGKSGTKYGEGSYFSVNASYSHSYAKKGVDSSHFMFLARVLVGSYTKGESEYRRPPFKDPSNPASDQYDSCVNDECNPTIFVVFYKDQLYPEYIIQYLTLERSITRGNQSNV